MCFFGGYSIAPQFSQGVITKLVRWSGISKPQLLDGKVGFGCKQTAVLAPLQIILIAVASISDDCARTSNSACALVRISGVTSSPVSHLISIT